MTSSSRQEQPSSQGAEPSRSASYKDRKVDDPEHIEMVLDSMRDRNMLILSPLCTMAYITDRNQSIPEPEVRPKQDTPADVPKWIDELGFFAKGVGMFGIFKDDQGQSWLNFNPHFGRELPNIIVGWSYRWAKAQGARNTIIESAVEVVSEARRARQRPVYHNIVRLVQVLKQLRALGIEEHPRWLVDLQTTLELGNLVVDEAKSYFGMPHPQPEHARSQALHLMSLAEELLSMIKEDEEDYKVLGLLTGTQGEALLNGKVELRNKMRSLPST